MGHHVQGRDRDAVVGAAIREDPNLARAEGRWGKERVVFGEG